MSAEMDASSHGGGLMGDFNMEALDTLPPFDDALIPEALGINALVPPSHADAGRGSVTGSARVDLQPVP